jgi:glycerophosphoryl diester phosphodiesterase
VIGLPPLRPSLVPRPRGDVLRISHRAGDVGPASYGYDNLAHQAALGAHLLEFDVRVTADDDLVVHHDGRLVPAGGGEAVRVRDLPAAEVPADVPRCADVIADAARAGLGLYADVKSLTATGAARLAGLLDEHGMADRTILASGRPHVVALCAGAAPGLPRAILFHAVDDVDPVALAAGCDAQFVHPCWEWLPAPHETLATSAWLGPARAAGLGVVCWHEERRPVAEGLYDLGVDGICGDDTALLAAVAVAAPA